MTEEEIKVYKDSIGKNKINLYGFTSTSIDKNQALSFAWDNTHSGHHKILFHIQWKYDFHHYFLNAGAYDHEQEILLVDGTSLDVISIDEIKDT